MTNGGATKDDFVLDAALRSRGQDQFDHKAIAEVVATMVTVTDPPINIALFGPWGSGKSSFFGLLEERLKEIDRHKKVHVAHYDAWKYGGKALKLNFVRSIGRKFDHVDDNELDAKLTSNQDVVKLRIADWLKANKGQLGFGVLVAAGFALLWFVLVTGAVWAVQRDDLEKATAVGLTGIGSVLGLAMAALIIGPKMMESASLKITSAPPETDDQFAKSFEDLVREILGKDQEQRLVVFIDELDRCAPEDVVSTLMDLKTFLDIERCVFVVAADREVLERALRKVPQAKPVREDDPYYSTPGAFLDKIFQHQIALPPLRPQALTKFARQTAMDLGGLWAELREDSEDERLFLEVIHALVPVHVTSPRRVKVLLNNYAATVRIAQARRLPWKERATEIAVLTVLQTEFPAVAADMVKIPRLLDYIRGEDPAEASEEVQKVIGKYRPDGAERDQRKTAPVEEMATETAAGGLLVDAPESPDEDAGAQRRANATLNAQLTRYLNLVSASQGVKDPRPDLFYLESVGYDEGFTPEQGYAIDMSASLAPDDIVAEFIEQRSEVISSAVRLLVQQADAERGPGRSNIIEAACRLVERLDSAEVRAIAPTAAAGVLSDAAAGSLKPDAVPGALILGVVGANEDLVEQLLAQQTPRTLSSGNLLARITPVLEYAAPDHAKLVHDLVGGTYLETPEPLEAGLRSLPLEVARRLWAAVTDQVTAAFGDLVAPPEPTEPVEAATSATTAAVAPAPEADLEAAANRYATLLDAVEARSDDAEPLLSDVLEFGQQCEVLGVRDTVRDREDDALERIHSPERRNVHALLGLTHAPLGDVTFWRELLTEPNADHLAALTAFERLAGAVPTTTQADLPALQAALQLLVRGSDDEHAAAAVAVVKTALESVSWSGDADEVARRVVLHAVADDLRSAWAVAEDVDELRLGDVERSLDVDPSGVTVFPLARELVTTLPASSAEALDDRLAAREVNPGDEPAVLQLRLVARRQFGGPAFSAGEMLVLGGAPGADKSAEDWLALKPHWTEATVALQTFKPSAIALSTFASALDAADRTELWSRLEDEGAGVSVLAAVGQEGVAGTAIDKIRMKVEDVRAQDERNDLVERLLNAKFDEQPAHRAATELTMQLLDGTRLDGSLAARVIIRSGGAAWRTVTVVRDAFDAYMAKPGPKISKSNVDTLHDMKLMSKRNKRGFGLRNPFSGD